MKIDEIIDKRCANCGHTQSFHRWDETAEGFAECEVDQCDCEGYGKGDI